MIIGILSARNHNYHPNRRLIEAAGNQGHQVALMHPENCLSGILLGAFHLRNLCRGKIAEVLLPRIGANISEFSMTLVRHFELLGVPVVNRFEAILLARNKFLCLQALAQQGIPVPDSHFVTSLKGFEKAVASLGGYPVVAKTPKGRQGEGVILIESRVTAGFVVHNLLNIREGLVVQEYLEPKGRTDLRAFVVGDRVVGAMELKPQEGDFRSNIHLLGQGKPIVLEEELADLAVRSTRILGLEISGTDIILSNNRAVVLEVNYSPGFRGLEAKSGKDIASQIIDYVVTTYGGSL
jgi:ribosomal protein S6--L-glutamate ligase